MKRTNGKGKRLFRCISFPSMTWAYFPHSISVPCARIYGDHHLFITIAGNHWTTVSSLRRPEVRERLLQQAWAVLGLNPKHAKAEKLRWFRQPAPRNTLKKPVTYPAIYNEEIHILPDCIVEMITGTWTCRRKLTPEVQHYVDWKRKFLARSTEAPKEEDDDDATASDSSRSTTIGPPSS
jgi:hypothetical protein